MRTKQQQQIIELIDAITARMDSLERLCAVLSERQDLAAERQDIAASRLTMAETRLDRLEDAAAEPDPLEESLEERRAPYLSGGDR